MNLSPSWKSGMAILGAAVFLAPIHDGAAAQERLIDDRDYRYIGEWRCQMDDPRIHGHVTHYPEQVSYHPAHGIGAIWLYLSEGPIYSVHYSKLDQNFTEVARGLWRVNRETMKVEAWWWVLRKTAPDEPNISELRTQGTCTYHPRQDRR
jgi:hypothetical protein